MIEINNKKDCCGCCGCINICYHNAISMEYDSEGFLYPIIDLDSCKDCRLCEKVCPQLNTDSFNTFNKAYVAINKNLSERCDSSSGGIFLPLARYTLENNGVVFGVKFNNEFKAVHSFGENLSEVKKFVGSKYIQSNVGNETFREVKKFLKDKREVLFTGTPCQIKALKLFLRKEYNNLITVDLLCHGVPSYLVFDAYRGYLEDKYGGKIQSFKFRDKHSGWKKYDLSFKINEKIFYENSADDLFIKNFREDLFLRYSCYDCPVKKFNSISDITIGDYWGVEGIHKDFDDDKGTSIIITHTPKGENVLNELAKDIEFKSTDLKFASQFNRAMHTSGVLKDSRKVIFDKIKNNKFFR